LVGDAADGYPGISGCGPKTAAQLINRYGALENFGPDVLSEENRRLALLFKDLATLRTDAPLFEDVEELRWRGPTADFPQFAEKMGSARLSTKVRQLQNRAR
jgi:5'-3' exonuclease